MTFGQRLRYARMAQSLTTKELAEKIDLFQSDINSYEIGRYKPTLAILRRTS